MVLTVPNVRQAKEYDCGDAVAFCVLQFHRVEAHFKLANPQQGTDPVSLETRLRNMGFEVLSGPAKIEDLKHFCDTKRPVITIVHWPDWDDSHYIVVRGVSRGYVYFHDPLEGPGKARVADFDRAWVAYGRIGVYRRWSIVAWTP